MKLNSLTTIQPEIKICNLKCYYKNILKNNIETSMGHMSTT